MTAVEFLKDFMWMKDHHCFLEADLALAFSKAELMEKEQMIEFAKNCLQENDCFFDIEKYYNETFKSE